MLATIIILSILLVISLFYSLILYIVSKALAKDLANNWNELIKQKQQELGDIQKGITIEGVPVNRKGSE